MNKLYKLETFLFEKLDQFKKENQYCSPAYTDDEIHDRGEAGGKIEAICQVIDELIKINKGD